MRGAAVVLVALVVASCGGGRPRRSASPHPRPCPRRAVRPRSADPCTVVAARRATTACTCCARTPAVTVHVPDGLRAGQRAAARARPARRGPGRPRLRGRERSVTHVADEHHFVIAYPMSWRARGFWHYPEPDNPAQRRCAYLRATLDAVAAHACVDPRSRARDRDLLGRADDLRRRLRAGRPHPRHRARLRRHARAPAVPSGAADLDPRHRMGPRTRSSPTAAAARTTTGACATSWTTGLAREGCRRAPARAPHRPDVTRLDWPGCRAGVRVAHLRIEGGRHAWPPLGGPAGIGIDGAEEIWRFFALAASRG